MRLEPLPEHLHQPAKYLIAVLCQGDALVTDVSAVFDACDQAQAPDRARASRALPGPVLGIHFTASFINRVTNFIMGYEQCFLLEGNGSIVAN